ncbi:hypothetical protein Deipr_0384 [Deinococcus proteolyticus MRP]|uniref:Uncharacterized protein n=1 Tax=Deinococcus proteolyticus (strain ATCC 35074 / DSM 20540 / JCM 6276 / NBRC 101906 / NCIMB 13154 / VKM Ac-1939 / CCM 2703 / MRP) TaxID=693977 RepID=F0RJS8_DEIPM|nr:MULTISPECIES: hypothetical protein [Deinococcus]ADY25554.1 hypothetical protein Deipr_0384 [Deinococcus proteolyticus MRP]MCY1701674.1 hypothetical protein [Deinococcus sp. SL84]
MNELAQRAEKTAEKLISDRRVRAVAAAGSFDTDDAWAGSVPTYVAFERGVQSMQDDLRSGIRVVRFPYEQLERWREWEVARAEAPLGLLASSRALYDPTGYFARIQRQLWTLSEERRADWREETLRSVSEELAAMKQTFRSGGAGPAEQITALGEARRWATESLYPALLTHAGLWPEFELRLPHAWRAAAGLKFPKSVYLLEQLYGFGGRDEARAALLATRGLKMLAQEKLAHAAFDAGYYDGAVRYLRDETYVLHRTDIARWSHLSGMRQNKLSTLLGITRSPLGPAALKVAEELLGTVREGE